MNGVVSLDVGALNFLKYLEWRIPEFFQNFGLSD